MTKTKEELQWEDADNIKLDDTILFGRGYDFFLAEKADGTKGTYFIWKNIDNGKYSLYRSSDGLLGLERYSTEEECKEQANIWENQVDEEDEEDEN